MPRTAVTPQRVTSAGTEPTFEAANVDGNSFKPAAGRVLEVKNGSTAAITVTIPSTFRAEGLSMPSRTVNVPATSGHVRVALGDANVHRQPDGTVLVNYSAVTTVSVAVVDNP